MRSCRAVGGSVLGLCRQALRHEEVKAAFPPGLRRTLSSFLNNIKRDLGVDARDAAKQVRRAA